MSILMGVGDFVAWEGGCLLIGRATNPTPMHSHYAIQIGFGVEPGIRFRPDEDSGWTEYETAIIASRQPHTMDATVVPGNAIIFVDPETPEGRAIDARYLRSGIAAVSDAEFRTAAAALFETWRMHGNAEPTIAAAREAVDVLAQGAKAAPVSDERILRATAYIRAHIDAPLTLEEVAREAYLSPGRFRHLFVEQTGTGLRQYILWRRFLRAWEVVAQGGSLSEAAHAAGFADAAHLTRTSHRMFGFPPSALQLTGRH